MDVIRDLRWLRAVYPKMSILWSTIIPQLFWCDGQQVQHINTAKRQVNREVCRAVCYGLGSVIGHQEICADRPALFHQDGVHRSDRGLEIFLTEIKGGLLLELKRLDGGHEPSA